MDIVAFSFVFDKYCPIMEYLGSKNCLANYTKIVQLVFLSIFNALYMCHKIRFDGKSWKKLQNFWEVNKAQNTCILKIV